MGGITAPEVSSGCWPAWMALVLNFMMSGNQNFSGVAILFKKERPNDTKITPDAERGASMVYRSGLAF